MISLFLQRIDEVLVFLDDNTFDYTQFDNQIFRELHCGRLTVYDTLRIYRKLVENHNYVMTVKDIDRLRYFAAL